MASNLGPGFGSSSKAKVDMGVNESGMGGGGNRVMDNMVGGGSRNGYGGGRGNGFAESNPRMGSGMRDGHMGVNVRGGGAPMMSGRGGAFDENNTGGLGSIASKRMAVRRGRGKGD